jgi:hypothetical protein
MPLAAWPWKWPLKVEVICAGVLNASPDSLLVALNDPVGVDDDRREVQLAAAEARAR